MVRPLVLRKSRIRCRQHLSQLKRSLFMRGYRWYPLYTVLNESINSFTRSVNQSRKVVLTFDFVDNRQF